MLDLPINKKYVLCLIEALLVCENDLICYSASFMPQRFLLGNSG